MPYCTGIHSEVSSSGRHQRLLAKFQAMYQTVVIFHCTFVCDARWEICSNWKRRDRKSDMTLKDIGR